MSHLDKEEGVFYVADEPPGKCELCGSVEETRPYGPGGKQICFGCGMKNPEERDRQFGKVLRGEA